MIAAIYARKSTEQLGVADEIKSVARQVDHARAYAEKKGWTVGEHVYVDDGISGAEFLKRPGLARLMNALTPRPTFEVLIMSEESRLGREQIETAYLLKRIMESGVRVFFYLEDRERTLDTAMDKVMLSLTNFAAEVERERASQRVYDAAVGRVKAGKVAGAKVFGYDNVPVLSAEELGRDGHPKRLYTERRVNETQAAVVRHIFALYADGLGTTRIAYLLNTEGIPAPRRRGWAQAGVKHMLRNEIYRGVVLWGRSQNVVRKGTKKHRQRPEEETIRREDPSLRIVAEDLWARVQARRQRRFESIPRTAKGQLLGRPSWRDGHSDYLLPGLIACAVCGGSIRTVHEKHGAASGPARRVTVRKYACSTYMERGEAACANRTKVRQDLLDAAVLGAIEGLLDEEMIGWAVDEVLAHLTGGQAEHAHRRAELEQERGRAEHRLQRALDELLDAAELAPELKARVKAEQGRKAALQAEITRLDTLTAATLDLDALRADLVARARDVRTTLRAHVVQGRALLRRLLPEPLPMEPIERDGVATFRFSGHLSIEGLLSGEAYARGVGGIPCA